LGKRRRLEEAWFLLRVVAASAAVSAATVALPLPRILRAVESPRKRVRRVDGETLERRVAIIRKVIKWKLFLIRNNCYRRNLLLYYFLLRYGVSGLRIHIGISKREGALAGHCWLTRDGRILYDEEEEVAKYAVIHTSGG